MSNVSISDFFQSSASLFAKKEKNKDAIYNEVLKCEKGHNYLVRLLPYLKEGAEGMSKTIFHAYTYAWQSVKDGRWIYVTSPKTFGETCPITEWYFAVKNGNNEAAKKRLDALSFKESWLYNVYIVDDPTNPDNNGTVKILKAGKQLNYIIADALSQDPDKMEANAEEYGVENMSNAIFDLSPNGFNLSVNVQDQGGFANYKTSAWVRRRRNLDLTDEQIAEIHDSVFDLTKVEKVFTAEEAGKIFRETFLGEDVSVEPKSKKVVAKPTIEPIDDEPTVSAGDSVDFDDLEKYLEGEDA